MYSKVLEKDIRLDAVRAKRLERLPLVLTVDEVRRLLCAIPEGPSRLMAGLMYGAEMRLLEVCRLRIKDVDFDRKPLMVRDGKGEKDRMVPLPSKLDPHLRRHHDGKGQGKGIAIDLVPGSAAAGDASLVFVQGPSALTAQMMPCTNVPI